MGAAGRLEEPKVLGRDRGRVGTSALRSWPRRTSARPRPSFPRGTTQSQQLGSFSHTGDPGRRLHWLPTTGSILAPSSASPPSSGPTRGARGPPRERPRPCLHSCASARDAACHLVLLQQDSPASKSQGSIRVAAASACAPHPGVSGAGRWGECSAAERWGAQGMRSHQGRGGHWSPAGSQRGQGLAFCTETNRTGPQGLVLPATSLNQSHPALNCRPQSPRHKAQGTDCPALHPGWSQAWEDPEPPQPATLRPQHRGHEGPLLCCTLLHRWRSENGRF